MKISAVDWPAELDRLPGAELIHGGLADVAAGRESDEALLIEIAAPRLISIGLVLPEIPAAGLEAEIRLYRRLQPRHGAGAHGEYLALVRRLERFCHSLEAWQERAANRSGE